MSDPVKTTQDVSPAGSCIRVERIVLSQEAKQHLSVRAGAIPPVGQRTKFSNEQTAGTPNVRAD